MADELVRSYFYVNPDDGVLTLRKSLLSVAVTRFQVNTANCRALQANITLTNACHNDINHRACCARIILFIEP